MARRPSKKPSPRPTAIVEPTPEPARPGFWTRGRLALAVAALLTLHVSVAVRSLVRENPTIDEVIHLPAGLSYWQTGRFKMYHHNPPLVKLIAALPLLGSKVQVDYRSEYWIQDPPNKAGFAHEFMEKNAANYFELFTHARLLMPLFSVIGGLTVFFWSRRLYGAGAGLLSLALWIFCPNILAHCRLVTTDIGATTLGTLATFLFWRYLKAPSWRNACLAGLVLGLAQLTKFSLVLLYAFWPVLLVAQLAIVPSLRPFACRLALQFVSIVLISVIVIDVGYAFEGVGLPLGRYEFACQTLTRPVSPGMRRPHSADPLREGAYRYRVNRFRDTFLGALPVPLPEHYLLGFDDQKLEAEGIPAKFMLKPGEPVPANGDDLQGYPVYLNGVLSSKSWWYYYLATLVYKVPEGTWLLVGSSLVVLCVSRRSRAPWFDEVTLGLLPAVILFVMSVFTNINLGLRYVLPIFPYVFIAAGKLVPWASGFGTKNSRRAAWALIAAGISFTALSCLTIHPHYLAYFNWVSGGPTHGAEHLIDSNIDWGQDLVPLRRWIAKNAPGERIGLAYFGQINPRIFDARGEGFDWYLPPPLPGTMRTLPPRYQALLSPPEPGLYAVSASLVHGLKWRVYDNLWNGFGKSWVPWGAEFEAFSYFRTLKPIDQVGYSIQIYRITPEVAARLARRWHEPNGQSQREKRTHGRCNGQPVSVHRCRCGFCRDICACGSNVMDDHWCFRVRS